MSLPPAPFGRVLTAMATPFAPDGSLDLDGAAAVAKHLVAKGNDGLVITGTTGESPTTTTKEDGILLRAVKEAVGDGVSIVAGVGTNDTRHSIELTEQVNEIGADGVLLVTPYYSKPAAAGILGHFAAIAEVSDAPVMLYDVPGRTGKPVPYEVYAECAQIDNVVAVKEAAGDFSQGFSLIHDLGYALYSGDDDLTLAWLAIGACGVVSVVSHVAGTQIAEMLQAFESGDVQTARKAYAAHAPAIEAMMGGANYGATTAKAALQAQGVLDNRRVRLPQAELTDAEYQELRTRLEEAGLL